MNLDMDLDFGTYDGLWVMLGLPILSTILFLVLSPLSFLVHKLFSKGKTDNEPPGV